MVQRVDRESRGLRVVPRKREALVTCAVVLAVALSGSAAVLPRVTTVSGTERLSVDSSGGQANSESSRPAISVGGRFVAFSSDASNLVSGDTNPGSDVFVHDRQAGTTELASVDSFGAQANTGCVAPAISADGRLVAFASEASNLVPGDTNGAFDVFVHDRVTGTTERVSVSSSGEQANGGSALLSAISADGRFVAFGSGASNLVPDDTNATSDIFVHDRQTGITERVSVGSSGRQSNDQSHAPAISADGRFVAFASGASNLVPGDTNEAGDTFVHDRQTGITERVSVDSSGGQANNPAGGAMLDAISADGRFVAFPSTASNLVPGDTNGVSDVFVHDRQTGITERVSVDSSAAQGNGESYATAISADGRFVSFGSWASNLVLGDTNGRGDVFVRDRQAATTERVSVDSAGAQANKASDNPQISGDGGLIAFESDATNLVAGDTNGFRDVFVRHRLAPIIASFTPTRGITGSNVTISGMHLDAVTDVSFGNKSGTFTILSPTAVEATVPNSSTSGKITVTSPDGKVQSTQTYRVTFSIVGLSPQSGPVGTVVTLTGIGFRGTTHIRFNGRDAAFTTLSPTSIQATVPAGATTGTVTATKRRGTVTGPEFTVTP